MTLESGQRATVIRILAPLHAIAVENAVGIGTPDVFFIGGCLELKSCDAWPRGKDTILRKGVDKKGFTTLQRLFAIKRRRAQGFHCVCLKVDRDWFLVEGALAAQHLGIDWTRRDISRNAWKVWLGGLNSDEFLECITEATEKSRGWNES